MKYLLLLVALILSGGATAECILDDGTVDNTCETVAGPNGEDPNARLDWTLPSFRSDNVEPLPASEIGGTMLFTNTSGDDANPVYELFHDLTNGMHNSAHIYLPSGSHMFVVVMYDQQVRTSEDSAQVKLSLEGVILPPASASGFTMKVIGTKFIEIP